MNNINDQKSVKPSNHSVHPDFDQETNNEEEEVHEQRSKITNPSTKSERKLAKYEDELKNLEQRATKSLKIQSEKEKLRKQNLKQQEFDQTNWNAKVDNYKIPNTSKLSHKTPNNKRCYDAQEECKQYPVQKQSAPLVTMNRSISRPPVRRDCYQPKTESNRAHVTSMAGFASAAKSTRYMFEIFDTLNRTIDNNSEAYEGLLDGNSGQAAKLIISRLANRHREKLRALEMVNIEAHEAGERFSKQEE